MAVKFLKPTSPGKRFASSRASAAVDKIKPLKNLIKFSAKKAGRNAQGKITVRHKGGGAKRLLRIVDFKQNKFNMPARVEAIEYDPGRNAFLARICYRDGERKYIVAVEGLKSGDTIVSSKQSGEIKPGNRSLLKNIPPGVAVSSIELHPNSGGFLARSAGMSAQVMSSNPPYVNLKLPSGEVRMFNENAMATIGAVSNPDHRQIRLGKAGRMRLKGIRPRVRGKAMNPVDHPHGGGEGVQPIGLKGPKTPWGKYALGVKTRNAKKKSSKFIIERRKKK